MRTKTIHILDDQELAEAANLEASGIHAAASRMLVYMHLKGKSASRDIAIATGTPLSRIRMAGKQLHERGWIDSGIRHGYEEKGERPDWVYWFVVPWEEIVNLE
jgi:predicted transcriptional regulator